MATPSRGKYVNPFYILLVLAGVAFCITACAYGVMTVRALRPDVAHEVDAVHPLVQWIDRHGFRAMMIELVILGICTVAAIATDEFWARRARTDGRATEHPYVPPQSPIIPHDGGSSHEGR